MLGQEVAEGSSGVASVQVGACMTVEPKDVGQHLVGRWILQIAAVCEDRVEVGGSVEETGRFVGYSEAHLGIYGFYAKFIEQPLNVRVVAIVVHDEAGVDTDLASNRVVDHDRVRMAAEAIPRLEQGYLMMWAEHVCTCESRDA